MMKSFFKKLAFVMALAMVVTLAAPAGTAALAADEFYIKDETGAKAENYKLAIGEAEDFAFENAKNWRNYDWAWTSSDTTVLKVDAKGGLSEGVADGVATVTVKGTSKADGTLVYTATCEVTVGKGKDATSYTVTQKEVASIEVIFDGAHKYTKEDVRLEYVVDGGYKVEWPLEDVSPIDGGFKVTPYVEFTDGSNYILYVGEEDTGYEFSTSYGVVTDIQLYYTLGDPTEDETLKELTDPVVKINTEDLEKNDSLYLGVKFFAGTVDVTEIYSAFQDSVKYTYHGNYTNEELTASEDGLVDFLDENVGIAVMATASIEDENGNVYEVNSSKALGLTSKALPPYSIVGMAGWAIVKDDSNPAYSDIDWDNHTIRANDDKDDTDEDFYHLVVKFVDSYENTIITDAKYADTSKGIYSVDDIEEFTERGYYFTYTSANPSKLLVGNLDASLTTYTKAGVAVIVGLYSEDLSEENTEIKNSEGFIKNATAFTVYVDEERKIDEIALSQSVVTLPSHVNNNEATFMTKYVDIVVKDQYGDPWEESDVELTVESDVTGATLGTVIYDGVGHYVKVQATDENGELIFEADGTTPVWKQAEDEEGNLIFEEDGVTPVYETKFIAATKKATVSLTGSDLYSKLKEKSGSVKFTLKKDNVSTVLTAKVTKVISTKTKKISVSKTSLVANDVNLSVEKTANLPVTTSITLTDYYDKSGTLPVGMIEGIKVYPYTEAEVKAYNKTNVSSGARFIAVYAPNGDQVKQATTTKTEGGKVVPTSLGLYLNENNVYCVCVGIAGDDNYMDYLATSGNFKVVIQKVTSFKKSGEASINPEHTATFAVNNNNAQLTFMGLSSNKAEITEEGETTPVALTDLIDIVYELVNVRLTGAKANWAFRTDDIINVYGRYNEDAGYIIITSVDFKVPLDGKTDVNGYTCNVEINEAIEVEALETEFVDGKYTNPDATEEVK